MLESPKQVRSYSAGFKKDGEIAELPAYSLEYAHNLLLPKVKRSSRSSREADVGSEDGGIANSGTDGYEGASRSVKLDDMALIPEIAVVSADDDLPNFVSSNAIKASVSDSLEISNKWGWLSLNGSRSVNIVFYSITGVLCVALAFIVLQFAMLVELRYRCELGKGEIARLEHQQDELKATLEQAESLPAIEAQAVQMGMSVPKQVKKLDITVPPMAMNSEM